MSSAKSEITLFIFTSKILGEASRAASPSRLQSVGVMTRALKMTALLLKITLLAIPATQVTHPITILKERHLSALSLVQTLTITETLKAYARPATTAAQLVSANSMWKLMDAQLARLATPSNLLQDLITASLLRK